MGRATRGALQERAIDPLRRPSTTERDHRPGTRVDGRSQAATESPDRCAPCGHWGGCWASDRNRACLRRPSQENHYSCLKVTYCGHHEKEVLTWRAKRETPGVLIACRAVASLAAGGVHPLIDRNLGAGACDLRVRRPSAPPLWACDGGEPMKAIILAAGLGRRMRPLSDSTHKTLLPIAGTTILDRLLASLRDCGVSDICMVTGYRSEELTHFVRDRFPDLNVEFVHNARYETTNNVFSMALALESITVDDDILLIESDLIVDPRVMQQIVETRYENAALVDHYHPGLDGTVVSIASNGAITQVYPSHLQDETFDFSDKYKTLNIYKFDKEFARSTFAQLLLISTHAPLMPIATTSSCWAY